MNFPSISIFNINRFYVDIYEYVHIHIDAYPVYMHVATEVPLSTAGSRASIPQRPKRRHSFLEIATEYVKLRNKLRTFALKYVLVVECFPNFRENVHSFSVALLTVFGFSFYPKRRLHSCPHEVVWTSIKHSWFLLPSRTENDEKQKKTTFVNRYKFVVTALSSLLACYITSISSLC